MGLLGGDDHQHTEITDALSRLLKQKGSSSSFESGCAALSDAMRDQGPEGEREAARALRKKFKYGEKLQIVAAFDVLDVLIAQRAPLPTFFSDAKMLAAIEVIGTQVAERRGIMSRQYSKSVVKLCGRYAEAWRQFIGEQGLGGREGFRELNDTCGAIVGAWERSGADNTAGSKDAGMGPQHTNASRGNSRPQSAQYSSSPRPQSTQYNSNPRPQSSQYNDDYDYGSSQRRRSPPRPQAQQKSRRSDGVPRSRRGNRAFMNDSADSSVFGESAQPLADADRLYRIPTINMKKEAPKIKLLISDSLAASTNLQNCLVTLPPNRNAMLDKQATDAFVKARNIRRKVLRYLQLVTGGEFLGSLIHANDELVAALGQYDDHSWEDSESESDGGAAGDNYYESESEDEDIYAQPDQGRGGSARDRVISPTNPFADDFEL